MVFYVLLIVTTVQAHTESRIGSTPCFVLATRTMYLNLRVNIRPFPISRIFTTTAFY